MLIGWYRPGDRYFTIGKTVKIGKGFWFAHPYATVLAADSIGDNFRCIHCTTLENTDKEQNAPEWTDSGGKPCVLRMVGLAVPRIAN